MPNIGPMEIAIVVIIALVIFGPKKLPELGKSVGSGFKEFKDGVKGVTDDVNPEPTRKPEVTATAAPQPAPAEPVATEPADPARPVATAETV